MIGLLVIKLIIQIGILIVIGCAFGFGTNAILTNKGYIENWFWYGFFFGIIAMLVALSKPEKPKPLFEEKPLPIIPNIKTSHKETSSSTMTPGERYAYGLSGHSLSNTGEWTCRCGRINPNYIGTCACGYSKYEE